MKHFEMGSILAPNDDNGGGAPGTGTGAKSPEDNPSSVSEISQLLENFTSTLTATLTSTVNKSIGELDKKMQDGLNATNTRLRMVMDDFLEVNSGQHGTQQPAHSAPGGEVSLNTQPATAAPVANPDEAIRWATVATRKQLREVEEAKKSLELQMDELRRDNRRIAIEAAVNNGIAKLVWADGSTELVAGQFMQEADMGADGKVTIKGQEPTKYIANWHAAHPFAQPNMPTAGSGNSSGASRRSGGDIDLNSYDPAHATPEALIQLMAQTRRDLGM